ncbi:glycosyltransferase family 2 protein [Microtetraspora fusca]|uniref:glycosyltransferase family 2 protein n=1 Tax=Microtetraspora fusca TaxID=1997 RepID=UPI000A6DA742|nr:glycosyltransferase family 2 protein [Microtetraspora fusca]
MGVKVSVVVSTCDAGPASNAMDACVRSVLEQSLPADRYEVIFADDGSSDGTRERLDAVAATCENVRVLHLDHSGGPARGRNVALSLVRGDYVYFMNQHDRLEHSALQNMYGMAVRAGADVLVGRLVGEGTPLSAFTGSRERADVIRDRLLALPTAHKLFRVGFLAENQIRFPDRPLAEEAFVTHAYLAAAVISIHAGQICCRVAAPREDPREDPAALVGGLRTILDIVEAYTPPGQRRDRIQAHWFRVLGLRRLGGARFEAMGEHRRAALFTRLRDLAAERLPARLDAYLPVHLRARAALLRAGRQEELARLVAASRGTRLYAELQEVHWDQSVLTMDLAVEIVDAGGTPLRFHAENGRLHWRPPVPLEGLLAPEMADVTEAARRARMEVYVRDAESGVVYFLPVTSTVQHARDGDGVRVWAAGQARLDIGSAALGRPLRPGLWEVHVRMRGVHPARTRVARAEAPMNCAGVLADYPRRLVVPCWSGRGELSVCIEPRSFSESIALVSPRASVTHSDDDVYVVMPVPYVPPSGGPAVELVLRQLGGRGRGMTVPALVEPGVPGRVPGQLVAKVPVRRLGGEGCLGPGAWRPGLRTEGKDVDLRFTLEVGLRGHVRVRPADARSTPSLLRRIAARIPGYAALS